MYTPFARKYNLIAMILSMGLMYMSDESGGETLLDLDNVNDIELEGVEDVPEFIEPPKGTYQLSIQAKIEKYEDKETKESRQRIRHIYSVEKVIELVDKNELIPADKSMFSETFMVNAEGLKYWKAKAKSILGDLGKSKVGEVIAELNNGVLFTAKVDVKEVEDKNDKTKKYKNVRVHVMKADTSVG